jgi:hypothetical protein
MVDYGEEGLLYSGNNFLVSGNTFTRTGTPNATAVNDPDCVPVQLQNNTFTGITAIVNPTACAVFQ